MRLIKTCLVAALCLSSVYTYANSTDLTVIRAKHCAEMGGIDITEKSIKDAKDHPEEIVCEINDDNKFQHYFKTNHPDQVIRTSPPHSNLTQASGYVASIPNGLFNIGDGQYYEWVFYITGNGATSTTLSGYRYVESEYSCGWSACSPVDGQISISVRSDDINKKIVWSTNPFGDYWRADCSGNQMHGNICVHTNYTALSGTRMDGIITHYVTSRGTSTNQNLGQPDQVPGCNIPTSFIGDPIDISIGNEFKQEKDIVGTGLHSLSFTRYYNSMNEDTNKQGLWSHNYSTHINVTHYGESVTVRTLVKEDGKQVPFYVINGELKRTQTELGTLRGDNDGYTYTSVFHDIYDFDNSGRLIRTVSNSGLVHNIRHVSDTELIVSDEFGHSLTITETKDHQPLSVKSSDGTTVNYTYDAENRLVKMTKDGKSRIYHYEDSRFPRALTGITDKNGIRYVTWTYDDKGRANSNYLAGGKDKVTITYNSDTQTTFTNPLGRKYTYNYTVIDGVKRISSINGTASSLCPAIGSSYSYNSKGLVTNKYDGKGYQTKYEYNDIGQETSRTIANGRAEAVTIKTTWDNRFNKPKTETYPDKVITYNYDNNGNLINQIVNSSN